MYKRNLIVLNVCIYVITVLHNIDNAYASRCSRVPEGSSNNYRSISSGNFRIQIQDDLKFYKPGQTYAGEWCNFICMEQFWFPFIFILNS